jgi:hypothetical protein
MARGSGYARGSRHPLAKLTEDAVLIIRKSSESMGALALKYGVSRKTLRQARNRRTWRHVVEGTPSPSA